MVPGPTRLYNPTGPDRVAVVSAEPSPGAGVGHLVRVSRKGAGAGDLFGPFSEAELAGRFAEAVDGLRAEGFGPPGLDAMLTALQGADRAARARAALRLGWRKNAEAVGPILDLLPQAVDEVCSLLDALGAIGDPRAIPALRDYAGRKLLSRRRSAVEALRALGDSEGLATAAARTLEQLPAPVRDALGKGPDAVAGAVLGLEPKFQGVALDSVYELGGPEAAPAVLAVIEALPVDRPFLWRYVKSIYKRSMLRHDPEAFGGLAVAIEMRGRATAGTTATLKSGYDGVERPTPVFRRKTQDHLRRLGWRYLSNLARHRPELYADAAAGAIAAYGPDAPEPPLGLRGAFGRCYLWNRVLHGRSDRFRFDDHRLVYRFRNAKVTKPPAGAREEAHPEIWDAHPTAYLRVLKSARLPEAHEFARSAIVSRHIDVIRSATADDLSTLLSAADPATVAFALDELNRRFDPSRPDLPFLDRLLSAEGDAARALGREWLRGAAPAWSKDQEWVLIFLAFPDAETAALAGSLAADALRASPEMRRALAPRLLDRLRGPEPSPGAHDVYAALAGDALLDETGALLSVADLLEMCSVGTEPAQALAGRLLAHRPEAAAHLGLEGLLALAGHEVASVRSSAHALIRANLDFFRSDASPLFLLAESEWADTRAVAFGALRDEFGFEALGPDGVLGLLDSNRPDVRAFGRELARRDADRLDLRVLALRLAEHPHPDMRRFALDLAVVHLPDGAGPLADVSWFLRAALLDLAPDRLLKRRVIDFLLARGRRGPDQAEVAARLLGDAANMAVRSDADHALEALALLSLAWPGLRLPDGIVAGAGAGGAE